MAVSTAPSSSWSLKWKHCVNAPQHRLGFSSPARCWMSWKSCKRACMYLPAQLLGCLQLCGTGFDGLDAPYQACVHPFRLRWFGCHLERQTTFLDTFLVFTLPSPPKISTGGLQCVLRTVWHKALKAKAGSRLSLEGEQWLCILLFYTKIVWNFTNLFFPGWPFLVPDPLCWYWGGRTLHLFHAWSFTFVRRGLMVTLCWEFKELQVLYLSPLFWTIA